LTLSNNLLVTAQYALLALSLVLLVLHTRHMPDDA